MMNGKMKYLLLLVGLLLLIASCGSNETSVDANDVEADTQEVPADTDGNVLGDSDVDEMVVADDAEMEEESEKEAIVEGEDVDDEEMLEPVTIEVKVYQFDFEPNTIEVMAGQEVTLIVSSQDTGHSLSIAKLGIHIEAQPGSHGEQTFVVDEPGEYQWDCNVYCGSGHGDMHGTLIVK
jgi:cytochrome c oxidase subunit II